LDVNPAFSPQCGRVGERDILGLRRSSYDNLDSLWPRYIWLVLHLHGKTEKNWRISTEANVRCPSYLFGI
jgi:hypothetical protein